MISDIMDLDSQQKVRYVSESSNASTSAYSIISQVGLGGGGISPSSSSVYSSPSQSPATAMQVEFSNLNIPSSSPQYKQQHQLQTSPHYAQLQNATGPQPVPVMYANHNYASGHGTAMVTQPQQHFGSMQSHLSTLPVATHQIKQEYEAELRIIEHPVEKFRFRYKSEMHGTHGSLNGTNSKRTPKTFPEVELRNFHGRAVIRCSLFQTNLESPHSHQLVVRRDDTDICDPHDLHVSPELGYVVQFQNMGIIHTAKKFIFNELLKKKMDRLRFELGRDDLSTKQKQELHKETEKEAKEMNLNQVRLCFEAFKIEDNNNWTRIAAPVYTNPINNRKSAQTGELRICRLSIATGSVSGGDDLILLVEKVSKKNIKVHFYELNEDEDIEWEAYGKFRESDVHHQYAIVCQTPPYKDKNIEHPVEVCIELVRPSDDERSYPPVTFRYKPRDIVASRKRRRTCSSANSNSSSSSSISSVELPRTVQEQTANLAVGAPSAGFQHGLYGEGNLQTISQEYNKDDMLGDMIDNLCQVNSEELRKICHISAFDTIESSEFLDGRLETDGGSETYCKNSFNNALVTAIRDGNKKNVPVIKIIQIYEETRAAKDIVVGGEKWKTAAKTAERIFVDYADKNADGESIIHDIITNDSRKLGFKMCSILSYFQLNQLLNNTLNVRNQSGLHCACLLNRAHYIRPLLGMGCDPKLQDSNGNTALHIAVMEKHTMCVDSFLNMEGVQLSLSTKNDQGLTPLHLAIRENNTELVEKLLKHDKSAAFVRNTKDGNNALHMAVLQQNVALIKLILNGQIISDMLVARNTAGRTAMDLAKELQGSKTSANAGVWDFLLQLSQEANLEVQIKSEGQSSADDDEDTNESAIEALELVKIKEEECVGEAQAVQPSDAHVLKYMLKDEKKFREFAKVLNRTEIWRILAEKLKIDSLCPLWTKAEDMLNHMKNKHTSIGYGAFNAALLQIDPKAMEQIQSK